VRVTLASYGVTMSTRPGVNMTAQLISAHAWVESPLQLICAVEYAAASGIPLRIIPLAGALQLEKTARHLESLGLPHRVVIERARRSPLVALLNHPRGHWIVGDAYSRFARLALAWGRLRWLTIVDDGAITLSLVDVLAGSAPLERPEASESLAIRAVALRARKRLLLMAATGSLEIFSFYPLDTPVLRSHQFEWLRSRRSAMAELEPVVPSGSTVILGSAAVVDGSQSASDYLDWVRARELPAFYYPHRRETPAMLAQLGLIEGLIISAPGLPIELVLATARGLRIESQPSSALATLRIIVRGRDCQLPVPSTAEINSSIGAAA
jgi:hypothetical protein